MNLVEQSEISDGDRDSMHILPLTILPLETPSLNRAAMTFVILFEICFLVGPI